MEKAHKYTCSAFALYVGKCQQGGPIGAILKTEAIIRLKRTKDSDISTYYIEKIVSCILHLLLPVKNNGAIGTETSFQTSFLNHPTSDSAQIPKHKRKTVGINKVLNANEGRETLHASVDIGKVSHGDTGIISLDATFIFYTGGIMIGNARYQIRMSSQFNLPIQN